MMNRRTMLRVVPAFGGAIAAGCQTFTDQDVASAAQKASLLAQGARGVLDALGTLSIPQLTPQVVAAAGVAISGIQSVADALAVAGSKNAAMPLVQKLGGYVNDVLVALAPVMPFLPPEVQIAIRAFQIMLPFIQMAIGMAGVKASPPGSMTEAEAAAVLRTYGARVR